MFDDVEVIQDHHLPTLEYQYYGTLTYERGFELVELSGWMRVIEAAGKAWEVIYGDPNRSSFDQRYTVIPCDRIIEIDVEQVMPLIGTTPQRD